MDNIVIWVALVGVISTLVGVYLGNWLQSRNIRQQREWMLQDQKREWVRKQRREEFGRILAFVEGTLELVLRGEGILKAMSKEKFEDFFLKYKEQTALAMPVIYTIMGEDKELANLLLEFNQNKKEAFDALPASDRSKLDSTRQRIAELAGLIRQRINKLLEETFD